MDYDGMAQSDSEWDDVDVDVNVELDWSNCTGAENK